MPGYREGDLIIGENNRSAIGTLVERTTRYLLLLHLSDGREAIKVNEAVRTLTWDQDKELSSHVQFSVDTGVPVSQGEGSGDGRATSAPADLADVGDLRGPHQLRRGAYR